MKSLREFVNEYNLGWIISYFFCVLLIDSSLYSFPFSLFYPPFPRWYLILSSVRVFASLYLLSLTVVFLADIINRFMPDKYPRL